LDPISPDLEDDGAQVTDRIIDADVGSEAGVIAAEVFCPQTKKPLKQLVFGGFV
jgi:hypothetical protein